MKRLILSTAIATALSASASAQCLSTIFASNNGGGAGWANYMDVTVLSAVTVTSLEANYGSAVGTPVGCEIWTRSGTYVGNEQTAVGWTMVAVDDGTALAAGVNTPTPLTLLVPFDFTPGGVTGVAIVYLGGSNSYTNGNGANQQYTDGNMTIDLGSSCSQPFVGGSLFTPRVWNGSFCYGAGGIGTPFCGPAAANSTGAAGEINASGSNVVANNDVTLNAVNLPANQFGYFLNSLTQGFVPMPGGSQGTLCLAGQIGRYNASVFNSGNGGSGSVVLDLSMTPTPSGPVAVIQGETWNFQCWYRDLNPMTTSNFTEGVSISFQ